MPVFLKLLHKVSNYKRHKKCMNVFISLGLFDLFQLVAVANRVGLKRYFPGRHLNWGLGDISTQRKSKNGGTLTWLQQISKVGGAQWCRTKSRSNKIYHWRFIHRLKRLCGTFQKQLTKKYGTGIFWNPGKIWHFWCFLAFFGVFGCHFHSAVLFPRVFGTAYDIYPPQTSA